MKIRTGFVSNSSSSSFIIAYKKGNVLNGAQAIADYIEQYPRERLVVEGCSLGEGDDVFEVSDTNKQDILLFKDRFVEKNKYVDTYNYYYGTDRYGQMKGYPQALLMNREYTYTDDDSDLSEYREQAEKSLGTSEVELQPVYIDNYATNSDYDDGELFEERYLSCESFDQWYEAGELNLPRMTTSAFAVVYSEVFTNRGDIFNEIRNGSMGYLVKFNPVYSRSQSVKTYAFFEIGDKNRDLILKDEYDFTDSSKELIFYKNATILKSKGKCPEGNLVIGFGKIAIIKDGSNTNLFKEMMF